MPKKLEEIKNAVMRSGKDESSAYAIATATYQKMKKKTKKKITSIDGLKQHAKMMKDMDESKMMMGKK